MDRACCNICNTNIKRSCRYILRLPSRQISKNTQKLTKQKSHCYKRGHLAGNRREISNHWRHCKIRKRKSRPSRYNYYKIGLLLILCELVFIEWGIWACWKNSKFPIKTLRQIFNRKYCLLRNIHTPRRGARGGVQNWYIKRNGKIGNIIIRGWLGERRGNFSIEKTTEWIWRVSYKNDYSYLYRNLAVINLKDRKLLMRTF